jgi:UDP-2,3-diacylglucosamine pyrophosphatase LpxH
MRCSEVYPYNLKFCSQVLNGVNFISLDDSNYDVSEEQILAFKREAEKGLPIVLVTHIPFPTPEITRAKRKFHKFGSKFRNEPVEQFKFGKKATEFIEYLKTEPLLKGILAGHLHITAEEQFSPTAKLYVVAGNFGFAGREVLVT